MEVIGIGDAHFDKLDNLIPDASELICRSWRKVFKYALEHGVSNILFYGDIGERSKLSDEAICQIIDTLFREEYKDLNFNFILGNHDFAENGSYSLRWLETLSKRQGGNVTVHTKPSIVDIDGVPFNMLPYPHETTVSDAVNIIHHEVSGSTRDNGRQLDEGPSNKHFCLAGHLHSNHRVRNTFFSGTLYQTNFGEAMPKFFHHATIESPKDYDVQNIPFKPPWELNNLIIKTAKDLKQIKAESHQLYKLFIKDGADIDINQVLTKYPNVVKTNPFKSKKDLTQMIEEAWEFDSDLIEQDAEPIDDRGVIEDWMRGKAKLNDKQVTRGFELLDNLKGR